MDERHKTELRRQVAALVPPLSNESHKGQAGKIGVIGGSQEYTGAPFFAAFSALKVGADISHVFCSADSAPVIKSYSPELIVHPCLPVSEVLNRPIPPNARVLDVESALSTVETWLGRFHAIVIGPGLGRDAPVLECVAKIIKLACEKNMPLIIDADGLFLINQHPNLVKGYPLAILTPNMVELGRLAQALKVEADSPKTPQLVSRALGGPTIVCKGSTDRIASPFWKGFESGVALECDAQGSLRRMGGQGDVLAGCIAAFTAWACTAQDKVEGDKHAMLPVAAYGACLVVREAARRAFQDKGRAMGAPDIMQQLGRAVDDLS